MGDKKKKKNEKIEIRCFGRLSIIMGDKELGSLMNSQKAEELIAFLATYNGQSVKKTVVCDALWSNASPKRSADSLYKLVRKIKAMPIPFHIECKRNIIQFHMDNVKSDLTDFLYHIQNRENIDAMEKAIHLYQGTLFEEEDYEWIIQKEGKFDMLYLDALQYLSDYYEGKGNKMKSRHYEMMLEQF